MEKVTCKNCGKENNNNDRYCKECGVLIEKDKKEHKALSIIIAILCTFILCLIAFAFFYRFYLKDLKIEKTIKEVTITDQGIAEAVEKVYDSVVIVENYVNDRLYGTGTGFVYKKDDKNGYILTNYHVIANSTKVKVIFTTKEEIEAEVVGSDEYSDIAVLKVDNDKVISVAELGSSEDLRVGDTAFTVGAPIDASAYSWTVTRGIISGKNREVAVSTSNFSNNSHVMEVLQTDAAINQGNSGGPLCNANGEVIGITNLKLSSTTIEGMGFAIPIEVATKYAEKIMKNEPITRPYLGVSLYDTINRETYEGVLYVAAVEENSPADKAGIEKGDIIIAINGVKITDSTHLKYQLYKYEVGDKIKITILRDEKEKEVEVTLKNAI